MPESDAFTNILWGLFAIIVKPQSYNKCLSRVNALINSIKVIDDYIGLLGKLNCLKSGIDKDYIYKAWFELRKYTYGVL